MTMPFRFGYQARGGTVDELRDRARRAEDAGFDVISTFDHLNPAWGPTLPLLTMAEATRRLRVCPMVLNNDFHHPVVLAMEYANLDHLTGGRVELGIGAGHSFTEYAAMGIPFDGAAVRKARMAEAVEILRRLLDGEAVSYDGDHYHLHDVRVQRSMQERLPILVGVNGRAALAHAAVNADTIGLTMLGRTLEDGHRHEVRWEASRLDDTVAHIRANTVARDRPLELNALVQVLTITDDPEALLREVVDEVPTLSLDDARHTPFIAVGTHDDIAQHLLRCRDRWGISYITVRDIDAFAPVIERLRVVDAAP
ncbi:MAG: TIGR03621 family F420-dependent LLM class oxidoreductase [Ilumatobacteraceae bacterium]